MQGFPATGLSTGKDSAFLLQRPLGSRWEFFAFRLVVNGLPSGAFSWPGQETPEQVAEEGESAELLPSFASPALRGTCG